MNILVSAAAKSVLSAAARVTAAISGINSFILSRFLQLSSSADTLKVRYRYERVKLYCAYYGNDLVTIS
jgi:hypothetical protein